MTLHLATTFILAGAMLAGGCATKKYVRNTTAPIQAKVDQVGEQATKQGQEIQESRNQIKQVDERAQSGISAAQERATTADNRAGEALNKADQATNLANQANTASTRNSEALENLRQVVSNLDDYNMQTEVTVPFRFDRYTLSEDAKRDLDNLAQNLSGMKRYFIAVEGYTDRTGTPQYNEMLSRRRADAVVQYLVTKHDVPIYRIHMIGLGSERPVEDARTRAARAKNRRVEVKLFTAGQSTGQQQPATTSSSSQQQQQPTSMTQTQR
jgi:outer membrane protein OmpA-like peptidoglycan-associated protein